MDEQILEQLIVFNKHFSRIIAILDSKSSLNSQLLISGLIGFFLALLLQIIIVPIKHRLFGPKLELRFIKEKYAFHPEIIKNGDTIHYIRVEVINSGRGIAKQCRAYLVNVEKENSSGMFEPTHYQDSLQLAWAAKKEEADKFSSLDLSKDISQFINVIKITEPDKYKVQVQQDLYSYKHLLAGEIGKFRYTIYVSGDNVKSALIKIISEWTGDWNGYKVFLG